MKLSSNFTLDEMVRSQTAKQKKIDNTPNQKVIDNLIRVCQKILEPVRAHFGKPVRINSGYRSPALNKAIGGARNSQHMTGEAVDFEIDGVPNKEVAQWIVQNLEYDQIILEFYNPDEGPNSGWVHVSFANANRKNKLIAYKNGRSTKYVRVTSF